MSPYLKLVKKKSPVTIIVFYFRMFNYIMIKILIGKHTKFNNQKSWTHLFCILQRRFSNL